MEAIFSYGGNSMDSAIHAAWSTAVARFFCPDTELFYEFVYDDTGKAWDNLPTLADIHSAYPNPCGWGTGMEDSVMNGGTALDALVSSDELYAGDERKKFADSVFRGLLRCTASEQSKGFVARSVSPYDGRSHYPESSRDQYTHLVYAFLHFYFSPLSDSEQRARIRSVLTDIAEKCRREVTAENDFNMLREDGTVGKVNKMWSDIGTHEWMRLPMFYLAAFAVTGEPDYEKLYMQYRDAALQNSVSHSPEQSRCYCSLQMQCSLRAVYDYVTDQAFRADLLALMKRLADYGEKKAIENSAEFCKPFYQPDLSCRFRPWNRINLHDYGVFEGYRYLNSREPVENRTFYPVREVGEGAMLAAMCPERPVSQALVRAVLNMAGAIDFQKHSSVYAPLYLACAYALCKENLQNI